MYIGVHGAQHAGKDSTADLLVEHYGYVKLPFSADLYKAIYELNPWIPGVGDEGDDVIDDFVVRRLQMIVDDIGWDAAKRRYLEVRVLLQRMGTEVGRDLFNPDFWINQVEQKIYSSEHQDKPGDFVFSDLRFPNEAMWVKRNGGMTVLVRRPGYGPVGDHVSERAMQGIKFDYVLVNDSTPEHFDMKVQAMMNSFGIPRPR